jgi:hypothetical protein
MRIRDADDAELTSLPLLFWSCAGNRPGIPAQMKNVFSAPAKRDAEHAP